MPRSIPTPSPLPCSVGEIAKWDGNAWICDRDADSTYTAGTGLALQADEFALQASFQLPQSCANDAIPKWNGTAWDCAVDADTDTLAALGCSKGELPHWNGASWECQPIEAGHGLVRKGSMELAIDEELLDDRYEARANRVIHVRATSSESENGSALLQALEAGPGPRLIRLEPGTYDLGTVENLPVPADVRIEGSGRAITQIVATGRLNHPLFTLEGGVEIGSLSLRTDAMRIIRATAPGNFTFVDVLIEGGTNSSETMIRFESGGEVHFRDAVVRTRTASGTYVVGISVSGSKTQASLAVEGSTVDVAYPTGPLLNGSALEVAGDARVTILDSTIRANEHVIRGAPDGGIHVRNSTLSAGDNLFRFSALSGPVRVEGSEVRAKELVNPSETEIYFGASMLEISDRISTYGNPVCVFSYDASFTPLGPDCR